MIQLDLTREEIETLVDTLTRENSDLSYEISNTDSQDFREKLKARRAVLTKVIDTLTLNRRTA